MSKAKAPKAKVTHTIPMINTAWATLVSKTKKVDTDATSAVIAFAKIVTERKIDIRNARKSVEELGTKSPILLTSQIEALPVFLALNDKTKGYEAFQALTIKEKLTKATAAYKLGADIATQFPTYEALSAEIKAFNKRKNSGKGSTPKEAKEPKEVKEVSVEQVLTSTIALVSTLEDGVEDSVIALMVELLNVLEVKTGVSI
jgi:predicted molibdopterin-dependent oxidoreductase YjgC